MRHKSKMIKAIALALLMSPRLSAEEYSNGSLAVPALSDTEKIFFQTGIEREGRELEEKEAYDEALIKYREATNPDVLNHDYDAAVALAGIERIYEKQGRFEQALEQLQWHLARNPAKFEEDRLRLVALIKARDNASSEPIYDHISYLQNKYKNELPPDLGGYTAIVSSHIIYLYDHIADYASGISFVEGILKAYAKIGPGDPYGLGNPYYQVKMAFEADKKDGRESCIAKPGCMGRATKALTQSDYFPW